MEPEPGTPRTEVWPAPPPTTSPAPLTPERHLLPKTAIAWTITAINVAVFALMELSGGSTSTRVLIEFGAKVNPLIAAGEYWRLITPVFLHIGLMHLVFNTFALLSFGRLAEAVFGHGRFLAVYLVSGLTGCLFSYVMSRSLSAGASGAIFGVAAALAVFFARNRDVKEVGGQGQLSGLLLILSINAVYGVLAPGIDNWGHAGGFLGGLSLAMWLTPTLEQVVNAEGQVIAVQRKPSSLASWAIVPVVLAIVAVAVLRLPGK
jgi:rhomboid protease GluP